MRDWFRYQKICYERMVRAAHSGVEPPVQLLNRGLVVHPGVGGGLNSLNDHERRYQITLRPAFVV